MRRTKEGFVPLEDDKPKDTVNSPFEASSVLVVKATKFQLLSFVTKATEMKKAH